MLPLGSNEALVKNHLGYSLIIDRRTRSAFNRYGRFDWSGLDIIERAIRRMKSAPLALDIGANVGNHTVVLAHYCRQVIAFEPQLRTGIRLADNVAANGFHHVVLNDFGLSDAETVARFHVSPSGNGGGSTLLSGLAQPGSRVSEISLRIGDAYLREQGIVGVDLIKIDVEGWEANVIAGLKDTIQRDRPLIFLEWNNDETRRRFFDLQLFGTVFRDWQSSAIVDSFSRSEFAQSAYGRLSRLMTRGFARRRAVLRDFEKTGSYENVVLYHPTRSHLILDNLS